MCGISGAIYLRESDASEASKFTSNSLNKILYRGPDSNDIYRYPHAYLGSCRLAINDVSELANMPMRTKCSRYTIIFNGEIYNHLELRNLLENEKGIDFETNSDTEVLLKSYVVWGKSCLKRLKGMYAFCIWDNLERTLTLARDPFGKKPLFFKIENDLFLFCSEITPIIDTNNINYNQNFLDEIALFGEQSISETVDKQIFRLEPGHYLSVKVNSCNLGIVNSNFTDIFELDSVNEISDAKDATYLLSKAINRRLISDRPIGLSLSGGVDSAVLAKLISSSNIQKKIPTFTLSFSEDDYEVKRASLIADKYNLDHHIINYKGNLDYFFNLLKYIGEPYCDPAIGYLHFLCNELPNDIKVLLTGDGGDETYLGYPKYRSAYYFNQLPSCIKNMPINEIINKLNILNGSSTLSNRLHRAKVYASSNLKSLEYNLTYYLREYLSDNAVSSVETIIKNRAKRINSRCDQLPLYAQYSIQDLKSRLPGKYLPKIDLSGSFNGLEIRCPYLDDEIAANSIYKLKRNKKLIPGKKNLKEILLEDFSYNFVYSKKAGFSPDKFRIPNELISESLQSIKKLDLTPLLNELSDSLQKSRNLKTHWCYKSICWNIVCINAWYKTK